MSAARFLRVFRVPATLLAFLAVGACDMLSPGLTYRYRVTVEVQTPQGLRSGSSVWEVTQWQGSGIPDRALRSNVRAEAVAVDLPGGTLFALVRGADFNLDYPTHVVFRHFDKHPDPAIPVRQWADAMRALAKSRASFDLDPDEYPLLVHFTNPADRATVEKVEPGNFTADLGPGITLKRFNVMLTDEPVTTGIKARLPWLTSPVGSLVDAGNLNLDQQSLANRLVGMNFSRGI